MGKNVVIFKSIHHGNTEAVAEAMADILDAKMLSPEEALEEDPEDWGIVGLGSGIYAFRHHGSLLKFADEADLRGVDTFVFCTYGTGPIFVYHWALKNRLKNSGANIIGEFACKGYDTFGPLSMIGGVNDGKPDEGDLQKARQFATSLVQQD